MESDHQVGLGILNYYFLINSMIDMNMFFDFFIIIF